MIQFAICLKLTQHWIPTILPQKFKHNIKYFRIQSRRWNTSTLKTLKHCLKKTQIIGKQPMFKYIRMPESESEVTQLCLTLWPHGPFPARLLCPWSSPGKNTGECSHCLLQGIFLIQGSNPGLPHYRQILCFLSHQGSPYIWESFPDSFPLLAITRFPVLYRRALLVIYFQSVLVSITLSEYAYSSFGFSTDEIEGNKVVMKSIIGWRSRV